MKIQKEEEVFESEHVRTSTKDVKYFLYAEFEELFNGTKSL